MKALDHFVASGQVLENTAISGLTTYKVGGPARFFLEAEDEAQLVETGRALGDEPLLVLGRGSNLIVSDQGFPGLVVRLGSGFVRTEFDPNGGVLSGGATPMPALARSCARVGRGGLEFLIGIPGSVGGGVRMNAGCHGSETREVLQFARVVQMRGGLVSERTPNDLAMTYRHTNLGDDEIVVSAVYKTEAREQAAIDEAMRSITAWRRKHQPGGTLNAGSVFKNPAGDSAGRIIDGLGLKGTQVGGARVSTKHANFFVAERSVKAQDIYDLVWLVRRRVGVETGVWLDPEVRFAGPFRASPDEETS